MPRESSLVVRAGGWDGSNSSQVQVVGMKMRRTRGYENLRGVEKEKKNDKENDKTPYCRISSSLSQILSTVYLLTN